MPVSSSTEHWIKPDALTINLNHFGDPDYLQVSVLAGAVVMAFKQDVIGYNAAHNYRTWPLEAANTYLEFSSEYHVYARLTRSEVKASALIVYDHVLRDIIGCEITYKDVKRDDTGENEREEILGEPDPNYFYIYLGKISSSINGTGNYSLRTWEVDFRFGTLDTKQYQNEEVGGEWSKMFRWNKVTDMIEVLKNFSSAVFKKLSIKSGEMEKPITDLKRSVDSDDEYLKDESGEILKDEEGNTIKNPNYVPVSDETIPTTAWVTKGLDNKYLRKDQDDRSVGNIASDKGFEVGKYVNGMIGGSGAKMYLDENGKSVLEIDKIAGREELIVPSITFNTIEVVSGDKANTFAYGRIKEVTINKDGVSGIATLDLLQEEYGTVNVNDILRGVFHNLEGGNDLETKEDRNGFLQYSGFFTTYFTPTRILENGQGKMSFRYTIQEGTSKHPCAGMNFFAYGNFINSERQSITYETRDYKRRLVKMNTWDIQPTKNIVMQDGKLDGLVIGGFRMSGYGTFQTNSYFTGVQIEFTPDQLENLKGEDSYSVTLSSYEGIVRIDADGNIVNGLTSTLNVVAEGQNVITEGQNVVTTDYILSASIQAAKGSTPLFYSEGIEKGAYVATLKTIGCIGEIHHGQLVIKEITDINNCRATIIVNCEGRYSVEKEYNIKGVYDGKSTGIETIYSKDKNPQEPEEKHPYEDNDVWSHSVSEDNIWMAMATKENENWTPWQVTRVKGYDAVEYKITPENTSIKMTMTGSLTPSKFNLTCYRIVGDERVAVEAKWYYQRSVNGVQWTDKKLFNDGFYTNIDFPISDSSYYEKGYLHYRFFAVPKEYDKYEATAFATVIEDGANGQMPRYRGIYKQGEEYVWDETYRDIMIYQGNAHQVASFGDVIVATSNVPDLSKWNQASKFDFVAMNTALIHEANIAGFTFFLDGYDDFGNPVGRLESQNKKIILDAKEGKLTCIEAELDGNLKVGSLRLKQRDTEGSLNGYSMGLGGNIYTLPILNDGENIELKLLYPRVDTRTAPTLFMVQLDSQYMTGGSQSGKASIVVPDDDNVWAKIDTSAVLKENIIYSLFGFCNNGYTTWYIGGSYGSTSSLPINIMVDKTLIQNSKNAVAGGAVYAEFEEVREEIKNISGGVVFINSTDEIETENVLYVMG